MGLSVPFMKPTTFPLVLVLIYFLWNSGDRMDGCCPTSNWERRHVLLDSSAVLRVRATSLANITDAVEFARRHKKQITLLGSGHSWSDVAQFSSGSGDARSSAEHEARTSHNNSGNSNNGSVVVCMRCYSGLVSIDEESKHVTVRSGTTLKRLIAILGDYNLALAVFPSINEQTIAGALATGTHATGVTHGNMASIVQALEIVTADGTVRTASASVNPDLFHAATIGMGLAGIITTVTVQAVDTFNLYEEKVLITDDELYEDFDAIISGGEYVKFWLNQHAGRVHVYTSSRTTDTPRNNAIRAVSDFKMLVFRSLIYLMSLYPPSIPAGMTVLIHHLNAMPVGERVSAWHDVFNIPHFVVLHPEAEYAIPLPKAAAALRFIDDYIKREAIGVNFVREVRFVAADQFWMSNDYGTPTCHVTIMLYNQEEMFKKYMSEVGDGLLEMGARPHWGKMFNMTESKLKPLYPKWDEFVELKRRLDPDGMFCNSQARRVFSESRIC